MMNQQQQGGAENDKLAALYCSEQEVKEWGGVFEVELVAGGPYAVIAQLTSDIVYKENKCQAGDIFIKPNEVILAKAGQPFYIHPLAIRDYLKEELYMGDKRYDDLSNETPLIHREKFVVKDPEAPNNTRKFLEKTDKGRLLIQIGKQPCTLNYQTERELTCLVYLNNPDGSVLLHKEPIRFFLKSKNIDAGRKLSTLINETLVPKENQKVLKPSLYVYKLYTVLHKYKDQKQEWFVISDDVQRGHFAQSDVNEQLKIVQMASQSLSNNKAREKMIEESHGGLVIKASITVEEHLLKAMNNAQKALPPASAAFPAQSQSAPAKQPIPVNQQPEQVPLPAEPAPAPKQVKQVSFEQAATLLNKEAPAPKQKAINPAQSFVPEHQGAPVLGPEPMRGKNQSNPPVPGVNQYPKEQAKEGLPSLDALAAQSQSLGGAEADPDAAFEEFQKL